MENNISNEFDRVKFLKGFIEAFLENNNRGKNLVSGSLKLLNNNSETPNFNERLTVLTELDKLFNSPEFIARIQKLKQMRRNIRC